MVFSGNGLNSSAGVAQLLAIDAETGAVSRISTLTGTATSPNGLLGLTAISTAGDGVVDIIYAGDQQGRLWKFDLSASDPLGWITLADGTCHAVTDWTRCSNSTP